MIIETKHIAMIRRGLSGRRGAGPEESYFVSRSRDITPLTRFRHSPQPRSYLTSRIAVTNARQSHPDSWRMTDNPEGILPQ
jgi:hypothetical protein